MTSIFRFVASLAGLMALRLRSQKLFSKLTQAFHPKRATVGFFALGLPLAVFATQCQTADDSTAPINLVPGEFAAEVLPVALTTYQDCDNLLNYIQTEALQRVGPYGLGGGDFSIQPLVAEAGVNEQASSLATDEPVASGQGADFSGTNVQVAGVDEADIVKTNGELIVGISNSGQTFWVADVSSETPELIGKLGLSDGFYQEMFLADGKAILIGNSSVGITPFDGSGTVDDPDESESGSEATQEGPDFPEEPATSSIYPYVGEQAVVITEVDLSDPADPEATRHLRIEGRYISSRVVDGYARVVVSTSPEYKLGLIRPASSRDRSEQVAERVNRELILESEISQWLPEYSLNEDKGKLLDSGVLLACNRVHAPEKFFGFNQVSVVSFEVAGELQVGDSVSVMADGGTVYSSTENLYVSHVIADFTAFEGRPEELTEETVIHKFSLEPNGRANYEGSGAAVGHPLNQFAFHEYDGRLFVATTVVGSNFEDSESFVTSLEDRGDELVIIDKVGDLGRGERIFAVRYIEDKAYVVTFRRVDPLYVVDLSDPSDLTTKGELKITGFSAYLHPIGDDLLLGVGQEATERGETTGVKFSLFDVSDPSDPRVVDSIDLEGGSSNAQWEHRAFLWWAPESLAVVPVNNYGTDFFGAVAVRVRNEGGSYNITLDKSISHDLNDPLSGNKGGCEWYQLPIELFSPRFLAKICPADVLEDNIPDRDWLSFGAPDDYQCLRYDDRLAPGLREWEGEQTPPDFTDELQPTAEFLEELSDLDEDELYRVQLCEPRAYERPNSVTRSLVIGDDLWTLSRELLQANDLDSLDRRAWVRLPN